MKVSWPPATHLAPPTARYSTGNVFTEKTSLFSSVEQGTRVSKKKKGTSMDSSGTKKITIKTPISFTQCTAYAPAPPTMSS